MVIYGNPVDKLNGMNLKAIIPVTLLLLSACNSFVKKPLAFEIHGIDVSHFQGKVDWPTVKDQGVSFAFIKATEGLEHCDTMFYKHWKALKLADIKRGAYHFFKPDLDPALQAHNFMINVSLQNGDLPPVLDMEVTDHADPEELVDRMQVWLDLVTRAFNTRPIIYTNLKAYYRFIAGRFDDYPIWIARYNDKAPDLGNNRIWNFWQYANSGQIQGIKQQVDFNAFNGSYHQLESLCVKNLPSAELMELVRNKR